MIYKAKTYCQRLIDANTIGDFNDEVKNIIKSLSEEVNELISKRQCKTNDAKKSCLLEVNNKWKSICSRYEYEINKLSEDDFHKTYKLNEDGFKAAFVEFNPGTEELFDLKTFKQNLKEREDDIKQVENFAYKCLPLEDITKENINGEILNLLYAMSQYHKIFPLKYLKPLAYRITLLRYWSNNGIDKSMIDEFNADPEKFNNKYFDMTFSL